MEVKSKAIGFSSYGSSDVFEEKEVVLPLNTTNNVLVKVERVGINPVDAFIRSGKMSGGRPLNGFQVLGSEVQGEIVKLYTPVSGLSVGDKVLVRPGRGGYAEYVSTNAQNVFPIPETMSLDEAAAFSATAVTAYWGLHGFYDIKEGQTIAVVGASGSVGSYLVQLAKPLNVKIIAVASGKNKDYLEQLGADVFIDYNDEQAIQKYAKTADFVMDASLFNAGEKVALTLVKENGTYLGMTTLPDPSIRPDVHLIFLGRTPEMTQEKALTAINDFIKEYGLDVKIAYRLPLSLDGVKEAHRLIEGTRQSGKIILSKEVTELN